MAVNLWPNADLEAGIDDWNAWNASSLAHSTTKKYEQSYSLRVNGAGTYAGAKSDAKSIIDPSTQYTASLYLNPDVEIAFNLKVYDQDSNLINPDWNNTCSADAWTRITNTFTTGADDTGVILVIEKNNNASNEFWYVDAVMLETGGSASAWVNYISSSPGTLTQVKNTKLSLGLCTNRIVCPQDSDTATHLTKYRAIIRNVQVPAAGSWQLELSQTS
jgi:hypothetical protein